MKPKTALQKQVVELSSQLPKITDEQKNYSSENSFLQWGVISRKQIHCLECAHVWKPSKLLERPKCPSCANKLKMFGENKIFFEEREYYSVLTTIENFQVVRMILSVKTMKKGEVPSYFHSEVMQHFIDQKGNVTSMAKNRNSMAQYYDQWIFGSDLSVQDKSFRYKNLFRLNPYKIYPSKKIIPVLKRNGFKTSFYKIAPQELFTSILSDTTAETLLKTKQTNVLEYYINSHSQTVLSKWNSIRICTKNNYIIKDFGIWKDYIDSLKNLGKDITNAKYICPTDLKTEHDRLVSKKRAIEKRENFERRKKEFAESQKLYSKEKKAFFGLLFSDGKITVKVLESVKEFLEEGDTHRHCVFTNEYYQKPDSLIFSASLGDKKLETIEISLSKMEVIQSRGQGNKATKYNEKIIDLVNKNIPKIRQIALNTAI